MIAYLTSVYARASDTFIRDEVAALRKIGLDVRTFSIRRESRDAPVSQDVRIAQESTTYLLEEGIGRLALASLLELLFHPLRLFKALALAQRSAPRGIRGRIWAICYLIEAVALARELRSASVTHLHNHIGENSAAVAMLAGSLTGIPFSLTIHGPGEFDRPTDLALKLKISRSAFTVAISEFGRSQLLRWASPQDWHKIRIVRCGVNPSLLDAPPMPMTSTPSFVCVGRLCEQKGHMVLLEAFASLRHKFPDIMLTLVGDGPLRPLLERHARSLGLDGRVLFAGSCSGDEVRQHIQAARAMILPSFAEGLPVVLMEAFALGRPVISTYVAGIPELVEPGTSGWLVAAGSMEQLADAIAKALGCDDQQLAEMAAHGNATVRERHNLGVEAGKLAGLFAHVEGGRRLWSRSIPAQPQRRESDAAPGASATTGLCN